MRPLSPPRDASAPQRTRKPYGVAGSLGNPAVSSPGLVLPTGPILGATPAVPPLVSPLV